MEVIELTIKSYEEQKEYTAAALLYVADAINDLAASIRELRYGSSDDHINCKGSLESLVEAIESVAETGDNASKEMSMALQTLAENFEG